jgi:SAM-dependent methyltransferase
MDADSVRDSWAEREGEFSPRYYAHYGPNDTSEALRELLDRHARPDPSVLELGCSCGRHLAHLHEHGHRDLHGIDINDEALSVLAETYPALAADGSFHHGAIGDVLPGFADGRFDVVFSVETLQHVHPDDERVFADVARVADDLLLTVENETASEDDEVVGGEGDGETRVRYVDDDVPLYVRPWERVFTDLGFDAVHAEVAGHDTLRVFRSA